MWDKKAPEGAEDSYKICLSSSPDIPPLIYFNEEKLPGVTEVQINNLNAKVECVIKLSLSGHKGIFRI